MDKVPAEIINLISSHLEPPLAGYATLSARWQQAIERRTFSSIQTGSNDASFRQFQAVFATPRRRALLRKLLFRVQLPSPSEKRIRKLQSRREAAANSLVYTRALVALFSFLHTWEHQGDARLTLEVEAWSSMDNYDNKDYGPKGKPIWGIRNQLREVDFDMDALHESGGLATVPVVSGFTTGWGSGRRVAPAVMPFLTKALPNASGLEWAFYALPRRLLDLRRAERMSLANALLSTAAVDIRLLTTLRIYWEDSDPFNHAFDPGSLVDRASGRDGLSIALRRISQLPGLQRLSLSGCHIVGPQMFEDQDASADHGASTWPSLRVLEIEISITTPDGRWYFTGDPEKASSAEYAVYEHEYDSDESAAAFDSADSDTPDYAPEHGWEREDGMAPWCEFRSAPDSETLVPFMVSMVHAVARMPVLRRLEFSTSNAASARIFTDYFGPGEAKRGSMSDPERVFHNAHLSDPRWVVFLYGEFDAGWSMPPDLRAALSKSSGEGCVYITGAQEEQF
jgi:hypothetical protein